MREVHCSKAEHAGKAIQIFFTPVDEHTGIQEFVCPYCHESEQWGDVHGKITRVLINGYLNPAEYDFRQYPKSFENFKRVALAQGFANIKGDAENYKVVSLSGWNGISSHMPGGGTGGSASVDYYLDGDRVRIHKALDANEYWYTLS